MKKIIIYCLIVGVASAIANPIKSNIGGRNAILEQESHESVNPYITDGLVAMWDGEWNVGIGEHDNESTIWIDLSGRGLNLKDSKFRWIDNALDDTASSIRIDLGNLNITSSLTIEAVVMCPNFRNNALIFDFYNHIDSGCSMFTTSLLNPYAVRCQVRNPSYGNDISTYVVCDTNYRIASSLTWDDIGYSVFFFGLKASSVKIRFITPPVYYILGASNVTYQNFRGYVHSLRIYSRALTEDEIAYNYSIDKVRFNLP